MKRNVAVARPRRRRTAASVRARFGATYAPYAGLNSPRAPAGASRSSCLGTGALNAPRAGGRQGRWGAASFAGPSPNTTNRRAADAKSTAGFHCLTGPARHGADPGAVEAPRRRSRSRRGATAPIPEPSRRRSPRLRIAALAQEALELAREHVAAGQPVRIGRALFLVGRLLEALDEGLHLGVHLDGARDLALVV